MGFLDSYGCHRVKSVRTRIYFWSVFSCIRTENRKIQTRNNSVFGHFSRSESFFWLVYFNDPIGNIVNNCGLRNYQ